MQLRTDSILTLLVGIDIPRYGITEALILEHRTGIEPVSSVWKTEILPLNDQCYIYGPRNP